MSEPTSPQAEFELGFSKHTKAAREARHALRALLGTSDAELTADAEIIVSELVTNVVRHTDNGGTVRARRIPAGVRIEVSDLDGRAPVLGTDAAEGADGGLGLRVVDHVASSWGVDSGPTSGKTVWAEISPGRAPP